jgi:hypothetical protein
MTTTTDSTDNSTDTEVISETAGEQLHQLRRVSKMCPTWCSGQHEQALIEGCDFDDAARHISRDSGGYLHRISNEYTGEVLREAGGSWNAELRQSTRLFHAIPTDAVGLGLPLVNLDVREVREDRHERVELSLTTGEARSLAAALLRLAEAGEA